MLFDSAVPYGGMGLTILKATVKVYGDYPPTTWMVGGGNQFSHFGVGGYR